MRRILPVVRRNARCRAGNRPLPPSIARSIYCSPPSNWYQFFLLTRFSPFGGNGRISLSGRTLDLGNCTVRCSVCNNQPKVSVLRAIWHPLLLNFFMDATSFWTLRSSGQITESKHSSKICWTCWCCLRGPCVSRIKSSLKTLT